MKNKLLIISLVVLLSGCSKWQDPQSAIEAKYYLDNYCTKSIFSSDGYSAFSGHYCKDASEMVTKSMDMLLKDEILNKLVRKSLPEDVIGSSPTCSFPSQEEMHPVCIALKKRMSQLRQNGNYSASEIQMHYIESRNAAFMAYRKAKAESQANLILEQAEN